MKTIRLLESGNFLLGIEASAVSASWGIAQFPHESPEGQIGLLAPEAVFQQKKPTRVAAESLVVQVTGQGWKELLLFSRDLGEYQGEETDDFPALYPDQARLCCPQAMAHGEDIVLLLDPDGFHELRQNIADNNELLISLEELPQLLEKARPQEVEQPASAAGASGDKDAVDNTVLRQPAAGRETGSMAKKEKTESVAPVTDAQATDSRVVPVRPAAEPDREQAKQPDKRLKRKKNKDDGIMRTIAWITDEYNRQKLMNTKVVIRPGDIPADLRRASGLNNQELHYLTTEAIIRCQRRNKKS